MAAYSQNALILLLSCGYIASISRLSAITCRAIIYVRGGELGYSGFQHRDLNYKLSGQPATVALHYMEGALHLFPEV